MYHQSRLLSFVPPPTTQYPFVFRGPQLFSLVVTHPNMGAFHYAQVSYPLLFLRSGSITFHYTTQHNTPLCLGVLQQFLGRVSIANVGQIPLCPLIQDPLFFFCSRKTIDSPLSQGAKQADILLLALQKKYIINLDQRAMGLFLH